MNTLIRNLEDLENLVAMKDDRITISYFSQYYGKKVLIYANLDRVGIEGDAEYEEIKEGWSVLGNEKTKTMKNGEVDPKLIKLRVRRTDAVKCECGNVPLTIYVTEQFNVRYCESCNTFYVNSAENLWEKACKEFLKGCSCVDIARQEDCKDCLTAFCDQLRSLATQQKHEMNEHAIPGLNPKINIEPRCRWVFKSDPCGYMGDEGWCDYTLKRCIDLGNEHRWPEMPIFCTQFSEKEKAKCRKYALHFHYCVLDIERAYKRLRDWDALEYILLESEYQNIDLYDAVTMFCKMRFAKSGINLDSGSSRE